MMTLFFALLTLTAVLGVMYKTVFLDHK